MRSLLALVAASLAIASTFPYIVDALRGVTRPNVVTWSSWALLNGLTAAAALSGGATDTTIFAGASAACCAVVAALGLRFGFEHYSRFDGGCQALAATGVVCWYLTDSPAVDVLINVAAGLVALLPTYRHSWRRPYEETLATWVIASLGAVASIAAVVRLDVISVSYPLYTLFCDLSLAAVISRRRRSPPQIESRRSLTSTDLA
jgi:hypothetical protein